MVPALRPFRVSICCHPRARLIGNFQRSWHLNQHVCRLWSQVAFSCVKLRPFSRLITISRWGDRFGEFAAHEEEGKNRTQTGEHESKPVGDSEYFCLVLLLVVFRWLCFLYGFVWCDSGSVFKSGDFFVSAVTNKHVCVPDFLVKNCLQKTCPTHMSKKHVPTETCPRNVVKKSLLEETYPTNH